MKWIKIYKDGGDILIINEAVLDVVRYQRQSGFTFIILSISHLETSLKTINDLGGMVAVWFCFYHLTGIDPNPILEINFEWIHLFVPQQCSLS